MISAEENLLDLLKTSDEQVVQSPAWFQKLVSEINDLINTDFAKLVVILYQMDVSETKLKNLLSSNPSENAGNLIAGLMLERQLQRIETRKSFNTSQGDTAEEERW
jgi:hypothetical protein